MENLSFHSQLGRVAESVRVRPAPLRRNEERSADKMKELDINARAMVVPETEEEADCEESGRGVLVPMNKSGGRD